MRKFVVAALAIGGFLVAGSLHANAVPLGNPNGISAALEDVALTETVHCRPGWRHHAPSRWRNASGCTRRAYRGGVVVVPRFYGGRGYVNPRWNRAYRWNRGQRRWR